jgi:hypothetical protein
MTITAVSDSVKPSIFHPYQQGRTEIKSAFVRSGVLQRSAVLDEKLRGGGTTFNFPFWNQLASTAPNTPIGSTGTAATPLNLTSHTQIATRISRNQSWGATDLIEALAGSDPMTVLAELTSDYWAEMLQNLVLDTLKGVFADNTANDSADYTRDISAGGTYAAGVTSFNAAAALEAMHTAGDSWNKFTTVVMHSAILLRAQKNDLIDVIKDSESGKPILMYQGLRVIVDDNTPNSSDVYTTYFLGDGALQWGIGQPKVPLEFMRQPLDATGGGSEYVVNRMEWSIHPFGHAYTATCPDGGPAIGTGANNLGAAGSWNRVVLERKQVAMASLITTEA